MSKILKISLLILGVMVLSAAGLWGYYRWQVAKLPATQTEQPVATDEPNVNVQITKNVLAGKFVRGEEDKIVFEQEGKEKELPTTSGFSFVCTDQIIGDEPVLEYALVTAIYPMSPTEIVKRIQAGEPILVMTNPPQEGSVVANSIVSSRCGVSN